MNSQNAAKALTLTFLMKQAQTPKVSECIMTTIMHMSKEDYQAFKDFMETGTLLTAVIVPEVRS